MRFTLNIDKRDMTAWWQGVATGKTTVVAINRDKELIALRIAGHNSWTGGFTGQVYSPAHFGVHSFTILSESDEQMCIQIDELFGDLYWNLRDKAMEPMIADES